MADELRLNILKGASRRVFQTLGSPVRRDEQLLNQKIDALGGALSARIDALDQKFDRRFEAVDQKFDRQFEAMDRQFIDLRAELSKQFRWTFSTMLALLGMLLTVGAGVAGQPSCGIRAMPGTSTQSSQSQWRRGVHIALT